MGEGGSRGKSGVRGRRAVGEGGERGERWVREASGGWAKGGERWVSEGGRGGKRSDGVWQGVRERSRRHQGNGERGERGGGRAGEGMGGGLTTGLLWCAADDSPQLLDALQRGGLTLRLQPREISLSLVSLRCLQGEEVEARRGGWRVKGRSDGVEWMSNAVGRMSDGEEGIWEGLAMRRRRGGRDEPWGGKGRREGRAMGRRGGRRDEPWGRRDEPCGGGEVGVQTLRPRHILERNHEPLAAEGDA